MATLYPYSQHMADALANPPRPGENRHTYIFRIAAAFYRMGVPLDEIRRRMEACLQKAGWHDRLADLPRDLAKLGTLGPDAPTTPKVWMPARNDDARRIALRCPLRFTTTDKGIDPAEVLRAVFRPAEWVCVAVDATRATTQRLEDVLPIAHTLPYVVANPMAASSGMTQDGRPSQRCHGNACQPSDRRFVVVEFDTGDTLDAQARLLSALHRPDAPLALVVYSGGKSLHGWYNVACLPELDKLDLFRAGCLLGADPSLWDRAKLVRMPGGTRENGARQAIFYFEPEHT